MPQTSVPPAIDAAQIDDLEATFGLFNIRFMDETVVSVRDTVAGRVKRPVLVCLHGIGSGAASWLELARCFNLETRLLAWDAPGYGASTPLSPDAPGAADYAASLHRLLHSLAIDDVVLVGHSLGALVATAFAAQAWPGFVPRALVLISPAQGYGAPPRRQQGEAVYRQRLRDIDDPGIAAIAAQRHARLLSGAADASARAWVHWNMARLRERGYRQAIELLCGADLLASCRQLRRQIVTGTDAALRQMAVHVWCGSEDAITPPNDCQAVADALGVPLRRIGGSGHACYVEQPGAVAALLRQVLLALPAQHQGDFR